MRFVILKVRNPLLCTVSRGPHYIIARSPGLWDWPTWLNKPWSLFRSKCIVKTDAKKILLANGRFMTISGHFFRQLHKYLSQNWASDDHFEVLNGSLFYLVQKLWPKMKQRKKCKKRKRHHNWNMNQLRFRLVKDLKMTVWTSVVLKMLM